MAANQAELIHSARSLPQHTMDGRFSFAAQEHRESLQPYEFNVFPHAYQPDRFLHAPDGSTMSIQPPVQERFGWRYVNINGTEYDYNDDGYYVPKFDRRYRDINDLINDQTYRSILGEPVPEILRELATKNGELPKPPEFPQGITFSWYRSLRAWMKREYPDQYERTVSRIQELPDREFRVLADPGEHVIMAKQSPEDQDTLLQIGQLASLRDLGFIPAGIWLPETAVNSQVFDRVKANGYLYTVVRSDQLRSTEQNPMWVKTPSGDLAVFSFDKGESGSIAFEDNRTRNGDEYLDDMKNKNRRSIALGMDMETFGHWKEDRNLFLLYITAVMQAKYGYQPFDIKEMLGRERAYTELIEGSSWSCDHGLERWTGGDGCSCDNPTVEARADKKLFRDTLTDYNDKLNTSLDTSAWGWREAFVPFYLAVDDAATQPDGDIWQAVRDISYSTQAMPELRLLRDPKIARYMLAKYYVFKGFTSCGWFFGETDRVERDLPRFGIQTVEKLVPKIRQPKSEVLRPSEEVVYYQAA